MEADAAAAKAAITVSLQEYFGGHLVRQGMRAFEDALNELVKEALRLAFPNNGDSEEAKEYQAELAACEQMKKDVEDCEKEIAELTSKYQELEDKLQEGRKLQAKKAATENTLKKLRKQKPTPTEEITELETEYQELERQAQRSASEEAKVERRALDKEKKTTKNRLKSKQKKLREQKQNVPSKPPEPAWLRRAYGLMGAATEHFTDEEGAWDTYRLVLVLKGELENVFVSYLGIDKSEKDPDLEGKLLATKLTHLMEARTLRAHTAIPSEGETLAILSNIKEVLSRCRRHLAAKHECSKLEADKLAAEKVAEGANAATKLLEEAHCLKDQADLAVAESSSVSEKELKKEDRTALLLYCALYDFERRLRREVGKFNYQDQTITLGAGAATWKLADRELVQAQAPLFKEIAATRHWLFHITPAEPDGQSVLDRMGSVLEALRGMAARNTPPASSAAPLDAADPHGVATSDDAAAAVAEKPWSRTWPDEKVSAGSLIVDLRLSARDMRIPVPRETCLVGRKVHIDKVTNALLKGKSARVVVHGLPGMGKDVVAAEVVRSKRVAGIALQAWLPASTDEMLREQLVACFRALQPKVVAGAGEEQEKQLVAIRQWLEEHNDWLLVVEDASWDTDALWKYIPATSGRLLVTSQSPLCNASAAAQAQEGKGDEGGEGDGKPLPNAEPFEVTELSPEDSIELIRKIAPFDGKEWSVPVLKCKSDVELEELCEKHGAKEIYVKPPVGEKNDKSASIRRKKVCLALEEKLLQQKCDETAARVEYVAPVAGETADTRKKRRGKLYKHLQLEHELRNERLPAFIEEQLGHLPLSVALCSHMLRSLGSVDKLIDEFPSLQEVDEKGRDRVKDRHYLGLVRSVLLALKRLRSSAKEDYAVKEAAERLLCVLSRLPGTTTPISLFVAKDGVPVIPLASVDSSAADNVETANPSAESSFKAALGLLVNYGLVKRPASTTVAAVVHQTVQGVVRQHCLEAQSALLDKSCVVMRHRLIAACNCASHDVLFELLPSVAHWCRHAEGARLSALPELALQCGISSSYTAVGSARTAGDLATKALALLEKHHSTEEEHLLLAKQALCQARCAHGEADTAIELAKEVYEGYKRIHGEESPHFFVALGDMYACHALRGDWAAALPYAKKALHHKHHTSPTDSNLATLMSNLAICYLEQGKADEALPLLERAVGLNKCLAADHRFVALVKGNLASAYNALGRSLEASPLEIDALAILQRLLPAEHLDVARAMANLGTTYHELGNYSAALPLQEKALAIYQRLLPTGHQQVATAQANLGATYRAMGKHAKALPLLRKALEVLLPRLRSDSAVVAATLEAAGASYYALKQFAEAAQMWGKALAVLRKQLPQTKRIADVQHWYYIALVRNFSR